MFIIGFAVGLVIAAASNLRPYWRSTRAERRGRVTDVLVTVGYPFSFNSRGRYGRLNEFSIGLLCADMAFGLGFASLCGWAAMSLLTQRSARGGGGFPVVRHSDGTPKSQ
jgi:hypothetical protein